MRELFKKQVTGAEEVAIKSVSFFLQSTLISIEGCWDWDMASSNVFCSNVMLSLPTSFEGTTGIIHPDDVTIVEQKLFSGAYEKHIYLTFRIITTYGEVKTLVGEDVYVTEPPNDLHILKDDGLLENQLREIEERKEIDTLSPKVLAAEFAEKVAQTGTWFINAVTNAAYYSDNVFQMHGLPAQSLNANLFTFISFIHPDDSVTIREVLEKCYVNMLPCNIQYRILKNGTEERYIQQSLRWEFNKKGENVLFGVLRDVTEIFTLEQNLQHLTNEREFQHKVLHFNEQLSSIGNFQISLVTRKVTFSDNYYRIFGLKPEGLSANLHYFSNLVHPEDREKFTAAIKAVISQNTLPELEYRIVRKDGKLRFIKQTAKAVIYAYSEMVIIGGIVDVTHEKNMEDTKELLENKIALQNIAFNKTEEIAGIGSWIRDLQTEQEVWSESMPSLLGINLRSSAMRVSLVQNLIVPDDRKKFKDALKVSMDEKIDTVFEFKLIRRGEERIIKATFRLILKPGQNFFIGTLQDITEQSLLQQKLNANLSIEEAITENIVDKTFITDVFHNIIFWNKQCEEAYNISKDEAIGKNLFDVLPRYKNEHDFNLLSRALQGERITINNKSTLYGKEYHDLSLIPLKDSEYNITSILHVAHDVTNEYQLREQLTQRLEFIEKLLEATIARIIVLDRNMNVQYWNKEANNFFRVDKDKAIGKNIIEILPNFIYNPLYTALKKAFRGEKIHVPVNLNEAEKDYTESYMVPLKNDLDQVNGVMWLINDFAKEFEFLEKINEREHLLRKTTELTPDAIIIFDVVKKEPEYLNTALASWLNESNEELVRRGYEGRLTLIHPEDRDKLLAHDEAMLAATDDEVIKISYRLQSKTGNIINVLNRSKIFSRDENGRVVKILTVLQCLSDEL